MKDRPLPATFDANILCYFIDLTQCATAICQARRMCDQYADGSNADLELEVRARLAGMMSPSRAHTAEQHNYAALQRNMSDVSTGPLTVQIGGDKLSRMSEDDDCCSESESWAKNSRSEMGHPAPSGLQSDRCDGPSSGQGRGCVKSAEVQPWPRASITVGSDCSDDDDDGASPGPSSPAARRKVSERQRYISAALDEDIVSLPRHKDSAAVFHQQLMGGGRQGGLHSVAFVVRPEDVLVQENDAMVPTDQGDFAANLAGDWMFPRVASEEVLVRKPPKIINGYLFGDLLGEGSYGKVKECLHQETLIRYAVKIFKHNRIKKIPNGFANVDREIRLLRRLKHLNLVNMIDVFWVPKKEKWYMVLDYCVCSLQEMLDSVETKRLPLFQAHAYFVQLIDGLEYLHGQRVIHKDIKPGNLLLSSSECLKISDLGVAEDGHHFQDIVWCQSGQGTPKFQPPEIAAGKDEKFLGEPVDIWASGVTLYNLLSGEYPFDGSALLPLYNDIATRELSMPTSVRLEEDACHLLHAMMLKDPVKRITIREIRKTDWWRRKHSCFEEKVNIPVKNGDPQRSEMRFDTDFLGAMPHHRIRKF